MTIVKNPYAILHHPFKAIDPEVGTVIRRAAQRLADAKSLRYYGIEVPLKLLECYCDITGQRITLQTLMTQKIDQILWGFAAAMTGNVLIKSSESMVSKHTRRLFLSFTEAKNELPNLYPITWNTERYASQASTVLPIASEHQQVYWSGWPVMNSRGSFYLRIAQIVHSHGPDFAARIYKEVKRYYTQGEISVLSLWNFMFDYLALNSDKWPEKFFRTEQGVKRFMHEYTLHHFEGAMESGKDGKAQIKRWGRFINALEKCLCETNVWASLTSPIKRPPPNTKYGWETKIKEMEDGLLVQEKLLTTIPLNVSDAEAMELLFFHIKHDLSIVRKWAKFQAIDLKLRQQRRTELAKQGSPITVQVRRGEMSIYSLADICATLESAESKIPTPYLCKVYSQLTGEDCDTRKLATTFGFPTAKALFAHQCLLVMEHPEITTEFLKEFELYNKYGAMTGFNEEHKTLTGYKNRKNPNAREQVINLSEEALSVTQEIIDITEILRNKLRAAGDDNYRFLFLTSGSAFFPISKAPVTIWNESKFANTLMLREELFAQFSPHSELPKDKLLEFIKRVRLSRIRTSRAVEIYLETKDEESMSRALGHEHFYPDLLSHYLPEPILAFIKARWVRIFQKAIICKAMEDSPNLLRAATFANIDELDSFLEKYSIKSLPSEAVDPERRQNKPMQGSSEAVISVSVPFLAALLSLEVAVTSAQDREKICGRAEYWSAFASKIKLEIANGHDQLLKKHLDKALQLIEPSRMEALIYVPSHWI